MEVIFNTTPLSLAKKQDINRHSIHLREMNTIWEMSAQWQI